MKAWDFSVYIFVTVFLSVYVSQVTNRLGSFVDVVINSCENGAQIVDGKCDCSDLPFTGKNCQTSSCVNGGFHVYDTKSSQTITRTNTLWSCYCKNRYSGYNCEICNAAGENCDGNCVSGYYGSLCQNTCYANLTETTKFLSFGDGAGCADAVRNGGTCTYCNGNGACNTDGACVCSEGFSGSTCSVECPKTAAGHCSGNGVCSSGTCVCDSGFSGTACQYECKEQCGGVGVCTVDVDRAVCACPDRYRGDYCQHLCPGVSVCSGRGSCDVNGTCTCEAGWEGTACNCQASTTCSGHGSCNPDGSCACAPNRVGNCEVCIPTFYGDECDVMCKADVHCSGHGVCNAQGTCNCDSGWAGANCSECAPDVYPLAKYPNPCRFVVTSTTCNNNGYANVNFGNTNFDAFSSAGIDAGKYMCTCNGQYSAETFCKDCVPNYYNHGGVECSRYCDENTCNNGACAEDGTCSCSPGFFGDTCASSCSNVSGVVCSGHGTCVEDRWVTQRTTKCECDVGYEGSSCQLSAPTSSGNICNGRGAPTLTNVVHTGITFDCNGDRDCGDSNGNFNGSTMSVAMQTALKQALFGVVSSSKPYGPLCKRQMAPLSMQSIAGSVGTINIPEWTMSALTNGPFRMEVPGGFVYPLYTNQKYPTGIKIDGVQFYGPNTAARKYDCTEIGTKEEAREAGCVWKDTGLCEYLMQEVDASKWCYERELYENKKCAEQFACDDIQFICTETCAYASAQEAIDAWNAKHMETPFDGEDLIRSTFNLTSDMYLPGASVSECPKVLQWEIPTRVYPSPRWWCQFGDQTWTTDNPEHQENDECNEIDTNIEGFGGFVVSGVKYNTFREAVEQLAYGDTIEYGQHHQYAETMTVEEMCAAYYNHSCSETWHSDSLANAVFPPAKFLYYTFQLSDFSQGTFLTLSNSSGIMAAITHDQRLTIRNENTVSGPPLALGATYTVRLEISDGVLTCSGEACPEPIAVSGLMTGVNGSAIGATVSAMHAFNDTDCKESSWKLRKPPGWSSSKTIWALCNERHGVKIRSKALCEYRESLSSVTKSVLTREQTLKCVRLRNNECTTHTIGTECTRWESLGSPAPCEMSKFTPGFNHKTPTIARCENEAEWRTWCNSLKLSEVSAEQSLSGKCAVVQCDCDSDAYIGVSGSACQLSCPVNSDTGTACGYREPPEYSFGECKEIETAEGQHVTESTCECQRSTKINCEEKCDDVTEAKCNSGEYRREKIRSYDAWGYDDFVSDGSLNIVPYEACVKYLDNHKATEVTNVGDSGICRWTEDSVTWGGTEGNLISRLITTKEDCKKQNSAFELYVDVESGAAGTPVSSGLGIVYDQGHRTIVQKPIQAEYVISQTRCINPIGSAEQCVEAFDYLQMSGHSKINTFGCENACGLPGPLFPPACYIRSDNQWFFNHNTENTDCQNGCVCVNNPVNRLYDIEFARGSDTSKLDMTPGSLVTLGTHIVEVYSSTQVLSVKNIVSEKKLTYGGIDNAMLPTPVTHDLWITKTDTVVPIGSGNLDPYMLKTPVQGCSPMHTISSITQCDKALSELSHPCPSACSTCLTGDGLSGGVALVNGVCNARCTVSGYCGTGVDGTDCTYCGVSSPTAISSTTEPPGCHIRVSPTGSRAAYFNTNSDPDLCDNSRRTDLDARPFTDGCVCKPMVTDPKNKVYEISNGYIYTLGEINGNLKSQLDVTTSEGGYVYTLETERSGFVDGEVQVETYGNQIYSPSLSSSPAVGSGAVFKTSGKCAQPVSTAEECLAAHDELGAPGSAITTVTNYDTNFGCSLRLSDDVRIFNNISSALCDSGACADFGEAYKGICNKMTVDIWSGTILTLSDITTQNVTTVDQTLNVGDQLRGTATHDVVASNIVTGTLTGAVTLYSNEGVHVISTAEQYSQVVCDITCAACTANVGDIIVQGSSEALVFGKSGDVYTVLTKDWTLATPYTSMVCTNLTKVTLTQPLITNKPVEIQQGSVNAAVLTHKENTAIIITNDVLTAGGCVFFSNAGSVTLGSVSSMKMVTSSGLGVLGEIKQTGRAGTVISVSPFRFTTTQDTWENGPTVQGTIESVSVSSVDSVTKVAFSPTLLRVASGSIGSRTILGAVDGTVAEINVIGTLASGLQVLSVPITTSGSKLNKRVYDYDTTLLANVGHVVRQGRSVGIVSRTRTSGTPAFSKLTMKAFVGDTPSSSGCYIEPAYNPTECKRKCERDITCNGVLVYSEFNSEFKYGSCTRPITTVDECLITAGASSVADPTITGPIISSWSNMPPGCWGYSSTWTSGATVDMRFNTNTQSTALGESGNKVLCNDVQSPDSGKCCYKTSWTSLPTSVAGDAYVLDNSGIMIESTDTFGPGATTFGSPQILDVTVRAANTILGSGSMCTVVNGVHIWDSNGTTALRQEAAVEGCYTAPYMLKTPVPRCPAGYTVDTVEECKSAVFATGIIVSHSEGIFSSTNTISSATEPPGCHIYVPQTGSRVAYFNTHSDSDLCDFSRRTDMDARPFTDGCVCRNSFKKHHPASEIILPSAALRKELHECSSSDRYIGTYSTLEGCTRACMGVNGCKYFLYGTTNNKCYQEYTTSGCLGSGESFVSNAYNMYEVPSNGGCYYNKTHLVYGENIGNPATALVRSEQECRAFVDYHVAPQLTNEGGLVCSYNATHVVWGPSVCVGGTVAGIPSGELPLKISRCSGGICECNPPNFAPFKKYTTSFTGARTQITQNRYFGRHKRSNFMQGPQPYLINHVKYKNVPITIDNWEAMYELWINSKNDFTCSNPEYAKSGDQCGANKMCTEQSEVCQTQIDGQQMCVKGTENDEYIGVYTYDQCLIDNLLLSNLQGSSAYRGKFCMEECPAITEFGTPCSGYGRCSKTGQCSCDVASTMVRYTQNTRSVIKNEAGKPLISFMGQESMTMEERTGWRGDGCEKKCPGYDVETADMTGICSANGRCNADVSCTCAIGFTGENCQLDCPNTRDDKNTICSGHGACQPAVFNATVSSDIVNKILQWNTQCVKKEYVFLKTGACDADNKISTWQECRDHALQLKYALSMTVDETIGVFSDDAEINDPFRPSGCYLDSTRVYFNTNDNVIQCTEQFQCMCKPLEANAEPTLLTQLIPAVENTLKYGVCNKPITTLEECKMKVRELQLSGITNAVSTVTVSTSSIVPYGCSLQVLLDFNGNVGSWYYPHFNPQASAAKCQDGMTVVGSDYSKFECLCAEKSPIFVSQLQFYDEVYSTSNLYVDADGKVVTTDAITLSFVLTNNLRYPFRVIGSNKVLVHTGKHRSGGVNCESTMISNADRVRPRVTIARYMDEEDTYTKHDGSTVHFPVVHSRVAGTVEACKAACLSTQECNGFKYNNGVCDFVTSWSSVAIVEGVGDFYEISSCKKVQELTQTCDILSKDTVMCAECACSTTNGFWGGLDCRTCKLGFGGIHCKKKCPGYDGVSVETICGGIGTCIFGSKDANGIEFVEPSCVCGDNPADATGLQQCELYTDGVKSTLYNSQTQENCASPMSLEQCQATGAPLGHTPASVSKNWSPGGCYYTQYGILEHNSLQTTVECKSRISTDPCNDRIMTRDTCKRAAFDLDKAYAEGYWSHVPPGCSLNTPYYISATPCTTPIASAEECVSAFDYLQMPGHSKINTLGCENACGLPGPQFPPACYIRSDNQWFFNHNTENTDCINGCVCKSDEILFNTNDASTVQPSTTAYNSVCGGYRCICGTKYEKSGGTETCSCKRGFSGFNCNKPTPGCLFGGTADNLKCKCEDVKFDQNQNCCPVGLKSSGMLRAGLPTYITDAMQFTKWDLTPKREQEYLSLCVPQGPIPSNYKKYEYTTTTGDVSASNVGSGCISELSYNPTACLEKCTNEPTCNGVFVYRSDSVAPGRCCYKNTWTSLVSQNPASGWRGSFHAVRTKIAISDIWDTLVDDVNPFKPCTGNGVIQSDGMCKCNEGEYYKQMEGFKCLDELKVLSVDECKAATLWHANANGYSLNPTYGVFSSVTYGSWSNEPQGCYQYTHTNYGYVQGSDIGTPITYYNTYTGGQGAYGCSSSSNSYAFVGCLCKRNWRNRFCSCSEGNEKQNKYVKVDATTCMEPNKVISTSEECQEAAALIETETGVLFGSPPYSITINSYSDLPKGCLEVGGGLYFNEHPVGQPSASVGTHIIMCYASILMSSFACPVGRCGDDSCVCPVGKYGSAVCTACPAGWNQDEEGQSGCKICPQGWYADTAQSSCKGCQIGKYTDIGGTDVCKDCPAGQYGAGAGAWRKDQPASSTYAHECRYCLYGQFNPYAGNTGCFQCPQGQYQDLDGYIFCKACPAGQYNPNTGAWARDYPYNTASTKTCIYCQPGRFNDNQGAVTAYDYPNDGLYGCKSCPTSKYEDAQGSPECKSCATGWYSSVGSDSASDCYCDIAESPYGSWNSCGYHSASKCYEGAKTRAAQGGWSISNRVEVGYWNGDTQGDVNGCWISTGYTNVHCARGWGCYRVFLNTYQYPTVACGAYGGSMSGHSVCICPGAHGNSQCAASTWANTPYCSGSWTTSNYCCSPYLGGNCGEGYYYRGVWTSSGGPTGHVCMGQNIDENYCVGATATIVSRL